MEKIESDLEFNKHWKSKIRAPCNPSSTGLFRSSVEFFITDFQANSHQRCTDRAFDGSFLSHLPPAVFGQKDDTWRYQVDENNWSVAYAVTAGCLEQVDVSAAGWAQLLLQHPKRRCRSANAPGCERHLGWATYQAGRIERLLLQILSM